MSRISKSLIQLAGNFTERDLNALKSIYDLRCLTANQIYQLHYSVSTKNNQPVSDSYSKSKINSFLSLNVIEKVEYAPNKFCYFLTSKGVDLVRVNFNLAPNIFDLNRKLISRGYLRPSELKLNTRLISHQIYLNQFYIDFKALNISSSWKYEDAKHATSFSSIHPDAILTAKDTHFFLEMDLGTENKKLLCEKWRHYRNFIQSNEFIFTERKIIVLFILENVTNISDRIDLIKTTIYEEILDLLGPNFDIYVGAKDTLLNALKEKLLIPDIEKNIHLSSYNISELLSSKHNLEIQHASILSQHFEESSSYMFFSRYKDNFGSTLFFIDEYLFSPLSALNKIAYFERTKNLFYNKVHTDIYLILIVDSIQSLYNDLSLLNLFTSNVFFTTRDRLENLELQEAVFQIDSSGNIFTFSNNFSSRTFKENFLHK